MITRKRLNISIDIETYMQITEINRKRNIKSVSSFFELLSKTLVRMMKEADKRREGLTGTDATYIEAMFRKYANKEPQPDGMAAPKRGHNIDIENI